MDVFLSRQGVEDEPEINGRTAFIWAAGKGANNAIKVFIKHNVDMLNADKNGGTGNKITLYTPKFIRLFEGYLCGVN